MSVAQRTNPNSKKIIERLATSSTKRGKTAVRQNAISFSFAFDVEWTGRKDLLSQLTGLG